MASLMKIYIINLYIAHLTTVSECPSLTKCIASRSVSLKEVSFVHIKKITVNQIFKSSVQ